MKKISFQKKIATIALSTLIPAFLSAQNTTSYGVGAGSGGVSNSMFGSYAGRVTTGASNLMMGHNAGYNNTSGYSNLFLGRAAGYNNTSGFDNVFIGGYAGFRNSTQRRNVFVGTKAGYENTGYDNVFMGWYAGRLSTGGQNTFIGAQAGENNTGSNNLILGVRAGENKTTGSGNILLGNYAGYLAQKMEYNLLIGNSAGKNAGSRNVIIGDNAGGKAGSDNVMIGYRVGAEETGSNKLYIDNFSTSIPLIYGDFSTDQLGINALPATGYTLSVGGRMISEGLVVKFRGTWPDYVFEEEYDLPALNKVESFLKENKHLPEIPSAAEIAENGINVEEISTKLLQKIEELTLYTIAQEKLLQKQNDNIQELITRIEKLEEEKNIEMLEGELK